MSQKSNSPFRDSARVQHWLVVSAQLRNCMDDETFARLLDRVAKQFFDEAIEKSRTFSFSLNDVKSANLGA